MAAASGGAREGGHVVAWEVVREVGLFVVYDVPLVGFAVERLPLLAADGRGRWSAWGWLVGSAASRLGC